MIVKFRQNFHVPGFGRKRFRKGIVHDVPEELRHRLPKSAKIMPENFSEQPDQEKIDAKLAADYARALADKEAIDRAGLAGAADVEPDAEPDDEPEEEKPQPKPRGLTGKKRK